MGRTGPTCRAQEVSAACDTNHRDYLRESTAILTCLPDCCAEAEEDHATATRRRGGLAGLIRSPRLRGREGREEW